jgi:hypothetical protein
LVAVLFQRCRKVADAKGDEDGLRSFNWVGRIHKCHMRLHTGSPYCLISENRFSQLLFVL